MRRERNQFSMVNDVGIVKLEKSRRVTTTAVVCGAWCVDECSQVSVVVVSW